MTVEQFWQRVVRVHEDICWSWVGPCTDQGYGKFCYTAEGSPKKLVKAHRFAYEMEFGDIPDGLQIDHLCFRPSCVNPRHLEPVTARENSRRRNVRKTRCINGHEYEGNTLWYTSADGYRSRRCAICRRAKERVRDARRRAARKSALVLAGPGGLSAVGVTHRHEGAALSPEAAPASPPSGRGSTSPIRKKAA